MDGFLRTQKTYAAREVDKKGLWRAGSAGCFTDNKFYGKCPRKTLLRYLSLQEPVDLSSYLMFTSGFAHEEVLINFLIKSELVKQVEIWEIASHYKSNSDKLIVHDTSLIYEYNGITISGRPDIVVTLTNGTKFGIEAKAVTSDDRLFKCSVWPFLEHVMQAAIYKHMLGIDFKVIYGCSAAFGNFYFNSDVKSGKESYVNPSKKFRGMPPREVFTRAEYRQFPSGTYCKMPQQFFIYDIGISKSGYICLQAEDGRTIKTDLTLNGCFDYYSIINSSIQNNKLPGRPQDYEINSHNGKASYSPCDYCEWGKKNGEGYCDDYDSGVIDYQTYINKVTERVYDLKQEWSKVYESVQ